MTDVEVTAVHSRESKRGENAYVADARSSSSDIELHRRFSFFACLGLAFSLLNSWTAMAASLSVVLGSGGQVAMVWGLVVSAIGTMFMVVSLAEICHVFPLSGGQYDWTYCVASPRWRNGLSFTVGWAACAGWISLLAGGSSLCMQFVLGIVAIFHPDFETTNWQNFLLFLLFPLVAGLLNLFGVKILPAVDKIAYFLGIIGIVVVSIVLLVCSRGRYQSAKDVFATFSNATGWPDGMAFIIGLLQSTLGLTAFDAASHMVEEIPKPAKNAPRIMIIAVALGSVTAWIFMVVILFALSDFEAVAAAPTGPLLQIYYQSTNSLAGATCLVMFNLVSMFMAVQAVTTVSSRMVMSFARDRGLGPLSPYLSPIHHKLMVPAWSIVFVTLWVFVFGLIYLGSSIALNAILSAAVVLLQISYMVPIVVVLVRGGKTAYAGHSKTWGLGRWRVPINVGAISFGLLTSVCFLFPPMLPVAGPTMNYAVVVLAVVFMFCGLVYAFDGRKKFHGPVDLEERLMTNKME
ncbi:amino acid transporter [Cutaneotrichosporon oleaginosum]|uniref:Amino acid transporter n=2 Tax=Cutaneotrichosporon oleaginosum TaxID=879819 RepID=A0A0J0XX85_9TREE|nr:amino acid transporter [Cutaneotrichosporon oleaginosum]KLT45653.1 amino acid transporter [Cutaneotrichosporon oleaginosum]